MGCGVGDGPPETTWADEGRISGSLGRGWSRW
jgi:hypothetical protein